MQNVIDFEPIGPNLWAVKREGDKIAEVSVQLAGGPKALIPVDGCAYTLDDLHNIVEFMRTTAHCHGKDIDACPQCANLGSCQWAR